ncbi:MAG TPA: FHA domain-containing protein, partial [Vicinamibacteria bacterium]|nr:FHA domain-containing protein [Vicinamibacteria bacterium]
MTDTLRPRLVLFQGDRILAVREVPPDHEWVLGRRPDSPLPLNERSISRQHARAYCDSAGTHLEDLGTPNGTWVDGAPLRGTVVLRDGQVIRLGQSTNPDPLLLRFEDPASRLLDTLARAGTDDSPSARPEAAEGESAERSPLASPSESSVSPFPSEPVDAEAGFAPPASVEKPEFPPARPLLGLGAKAIVGAGLAFLAVFWLLWALKSTQKPWQSVRVEPLRAQTGTKVEIRGSEVEPAESLKVLVEDQEAHIEEAVPGSLVFTVPELRGAEAGARAVTLRVERQRIVVLRQSLQYETAPTIERVEPAEAAVGDVVAVIGSGFVSDPARVQVRVGSRPAAVVSAAPRRLEVRVPVVTRDTTIEAPVEVGVEGLRSAPAPLIVRRREAACYALSFEARPTSRRVFEVWHSFGPAVLVEGSSSGGTTAESEWPAAVRQSVAALEAAFAAAR